jgi:hypothetical protein
MRASPLESAPLMPPPEEADDNNNNSSRFARALPLLLANQRAWRLAPALPAALSALLGPGEYGTGDGGVVWYGGRSDCACYDGCQLHAALAALQRAADAARLRGALACVCRAARDAVASADGGGGAGASARATAAAKNAERELAVVQADALAALCAQMLDTEVLTELHHTQVRTRRHPRARTAAQKTYGGGGETMTDDGNKHRLTRRGLRRWRS